MDLLNQESKSRAKSEFQAIILSGMGSQLGPLIASHGDDPTPKALLPVHNKPLVSYGLSWLEEANIKEALIVCPPSHVAPLTDHIQATSPNLKVDIKAFEPDMDGPISTVSILRKIANRIHSDFVLLSCDFVPSLNMKLSSLLNMWRVDMTGMVAASLFYEASDEAQKRKDKPPPTVTYREGDILHVSYDNEKQAQIPMHLLTKFGTCRMTRKLVDSHVYIFKKTVLDVLPLVPSMKSIKKDLIPLLCTLQYSRTKRRELSNVLVHPESITTAENVQEKGSISLMTALQYSTTQSLEIKKTAHVQRPQTPTPAGKAPWGSSEDSSEGNSDSEPEEEDPVFVPSLRCGLIIQKRSKDEICGRVDTLASYREINLSLLREGSLDARGGRDGIDPKAQISTNSAWADSSRIGEGSVVARSSVGQHCVVGKNVKIINSIIMEHVEIGDWVKIENCVLSRHTKVGEKTQLKDCESAPGAEIKAGASYQGVSLDGTEKANIVLGDE